MMLSRSDPQRRDGRRVWTCVAGHFQTGGVWRTEDDPHTLWGWCDACHSDMAVGGQYLLMHILSDPTSAPIRPHTLAP